MTTTETQTSLPAAIPTQEITAAREHSLMQIQHALTAAWNLAEGLSDEQKAQTQHALTVAWENAQIMAAQWAETQELMSRSLALVQGHEVALAETSRQRDQAMSELTSLVTALKNRDINHPTIMNFYSQLYEEVMDEHNAAFWESLPYDVAEVMGGEWDFMDADALYNLISTPDMDDEGIAADYGTTPEKVREARAKLLAVVREFDKSNS
jgi:hypothetical protein